MGEGIRKYRKQAGLTQEKLAERIDINPVYMGQIERGYRVPTVDVLLRIARALKVRLRDIVCELRAFPNYPLAIPLCHVGTVCRAWTAPRRLASSGEATASRTSKSVVSGS